MACETCEVKRVGACTAHGGAGWDPRAGPHPCPDAPVTTPVIDSDEIQKRARLLNEPCAVVIARAALEEPIPAAGPKEEEKPGCFGAIDVGIHHREGCPCTWAARCRQSQMDA